MGSDWYALLYKGFNNPLFIKVHTEPYPAPTVLYFGHADFKFVPTNDVKYAAIMRMKLPNTPFFFISIR